MSFESIFYLKLVDSLTKFDSGEDMTRSRKIHICVQELCILNEPSQEEGYARNVQIFIWTTSPQGKLKKKPQNQLHQPPGNAEMMMMTTIIKKRFIMFCTPFAISPSIPRTRYPSAMQVVLSRFFMMCKISFYA